MHITIYSTTTCSTCHILTSWLDAHGLQYEKKQTDEDPEAMMEFMRVNDGMISVPFMVVTHDDGSTAKLSGYETGKLRELFGTV